MSAKTIAGFLPLGLRRIAQIIGTHRLSVFTYARPFHGVYKSFDDVGGTPPEPDQVSAAIAGRGPHIDPATDLPKLPQSRTLLPLTAAFLYRDAPLRILDFGGAAGVDFLHLAAALPKHIEFRYHVVDLPGVCDAGRKRFANDHRITFSPEIPDREFDLIYSWGTVHFIKEPMALLEKFASLNPKAILIVSSPFRNGAAYVRKQINQSNPFPQWVLGLPEVVSQMERLDYRLDYHSSGDEDFDIWGPEEYRVCNSAQLLFIRSQKTQ